MNNVCEFIIQAAKAHGRSSLPDHDNEVRDLQEALRVVCELLDEAQVVALNGWAAKNCYGSDDDLED